MAVLVNGKMWITANGFHALGLTLLAFLKTSQDPQKLCKYPTYFLCEEAILFCYRAHQVFLIVYRNFKLAAESWHRSLS
jgi:hypothetical protein